MSICGPRALPARSTSGARPRALPDGGLGDEVAVVVARPVISSTATGGSLPFLRRPLAVAARACLRRSCSASRRLRSMRAPPLMPNARAISRLPTLLRRVAHEVEDFLAAGRPSALGRRALLGLRFARHVSSLSSGASWDLRQALSLSASVRQVAAWLCSLACLGIRAWAFAAGLLPARSAFGGFSLPAAFVAPAAWAFCHRPWRRAPASSCDRLVDAERRRIGALGHGGVDLVVASRRARSVPSSTWILPPPPGCSPSSFSTVFA